MLFWNLRERLIHQLLFSFLKEVAIFWLERESKTLQTLKMQLLPVPLLELTTFVSWQNTTVSLLFFILITAPKKLLGWFEGMVRADEAYYAIHGEPLFSSHMIDLSEEDLKENVEVCVKYFKRLAKINCFLEMELGITGGEEDGVDNSGVDSTKFYTQPDEVHYVYKTLRAISPMFSIAAAFGNVHGVYKPGNVQLRPEILGNAQAYIKKAENLSEEKPAFFVFHGGSGSEKDKIELALTLGVVKMNIDTDTQWAYWDGVRQFEAKNREYLQGQIGSPKGADKPNKKFYDPRAWIRKGEQALIARVQEAYRDLNSINRLAVASKL